VPQDIGETLSKKLTGLCRFNTSECFRLTAVGSDSGNGIFHIPQEFHSGGLAQRDVPSENSQFVRTINRNMTPHERVKNRQHYFTRIFIMKTSITLYTKGYCPFCKRAKSLLAQQNITEWTEYDLEVVPERLDEMITRSNGRRTVPQIFIGDKHIGGSDDLYDLIACRRCYIGGRNRRNVRLS